MNNAQITVDPEIMSGAPVFKGTRVPINHFFDWIEGGQSLDTFLEEFPSVKREQVLRLLGDIRSDLLKNIASKSFE